MRRELAAILLCFVAAAALAALTWPASRDAKAQAPAATAEKAAPRSVLLKSKLVHAGACLNDGVQALLDLGERDIEALTDWAVRRCGDNLVYYLTHELERPERMAAGYVRAVAHKEVVLLASQRQ